MTSDETRVITADNETVVFQQGYPRGILDRVWFCKVTMDGITVEDYANSKRAALRLARRAWKKASQNRWKEQYGYPRVIKEENGH